MKSDFAHSNFNSGETKTLVKQNFIFTSLYMLYLPKTKRFGCVGRVDLTLLFFSKVVK